MTLNLNIDKLAGPGRRKIPLEFSVVRPLGGADIEQLAATDRGVVPTPLQRITDRHHSLARLLASGMTEGEAALTLNYDPSRISILKQSPAFVELLALYRKEVDREFASVLDHMAGLGKDALLELRQRIEDEPGKFSHRELLAIVTELTDRAGAGESSSKLPSVIELVAVESTGHDEY